MTTAAAPPSITRAPVVARRRLAPGVVMLTLEAPPIAAAAQPLQFVQIGLPAGIPGGVPAVPPPDAGQAAPPSGAVSEPAPLPAPGRPLLRRPFSIYDVDAARGQITIVFRVVGPGTWLLAGLPPGAAVDLLGPLGRPAPPAVGGGGPAGQELLWVVASSWQLVALRLLAARALQGGVAVRVLVAAEGEAAEHLARLWKEEPAVSPADPVAPARALPRGDAGGSAPGLAGVLTVVSPKSLPVLLAETLDAATGAGSEARAGHQRAGTERGQGPAGSRPRLFAAGPPAFLAAVQRQVRGRPVDAYLVVDTPMPCGYGACLGCAVAVQEPGGVRYRRACTDGRWFSAAEVVL